MKIIQAGELEIIANQMLVKVGTPEDIASYVATSLVDSNLKGIDSHGITRISMYINQA